MSKRSRLRWLTITPMCFAFAAIPSIANAQPAPDPAATQPPAAPLGGGSAVPPTSPASPAPDPNKTTAVEFTSLRLMLQKGLITQAEFDSAMRDMGESTGMRAGDSGTFVLGKFATTVYGFVEGDMIYDTTQSLNEIGGNTQIARGTTYAGSHDRMQFTLRNSRVGLRIKAPETNGIRASGQMEMDFFGTQLPFGGANPGTEGSNYNNAILRFRHMNLKIETPVVDLLIGQYWTLYGGSGQYLPATVQIQGIPGEIFSRQMQVRISKTIKTPDVTFEAAVAALRPPQRDSATPAGQAGLRFALNKWTAPQTLNLTGTSIQPLSLSVTGDLRSFRVPEFAADPKVSNTRMGGGIAIDAFIPVIPGKKESKGNSLALNGEFSTSRGAADLYTGLGGGVANPPLPSPAGTPAPAFNGLIDNGLAVYDATGSLQLVQWSTVLVGAQYYLPGAGNWFVSVNYSRTDSTNTNLVGAAAKSRKSLDWYDANIFWDATSAVRVAAEYAITRDTYNDDQHATNQRFQLTGAFLF